MSELAGELFRIIGTRDAPSARRQEFLDLVYYYEQACQIIEETEKMEKIFEDYPNLASYEIHVGPENYAISIKNIVVPESETREVRRELYKACFIENLSENIKCSLGTIPVVRGRVKDALLAIMSKQELDALMAVDNYEKNKLESELTPSNPTKTSKL